MNKEIDLKGLEDEPENIKSIIRDRPDYWEYTLASNLLDTRLVNISQKYDALESGVQGKRIKISDDLAFIDWAEPLVNKSLEIMLDIGNTISKDLQKSFGSHGKHGNAAKIKGVVDKIATGCENFLALEIEIRLIDPPPRYRKLIKLMEGLTVTYFKTVMQWNDRLRFVAMDLVSPKPRNKYDLGITLTSPPQLEAIDMELKKINIDMRRSQQNNEEIRSNILGETYTGKTKSNVNKRTRANVRQTVSIVSKFIKMFK